MGCAPVRRDNRETIDRTGAQTMLYLSYTMIANVPFAHYGISCAKRLGLFGLWYNFYRKNSKIWDTSNNCHNYPKIGKV